MTALWHRLLTWLFGPEAPPARHTATGPVLMGGSVRADLQSHNAPCSPSDALWLHHAEGMIYFRAADDAAAWRILSGMGKPHRRDR